MIIQRELIEYSEKHEVPTSTVDKDWVLGHFLNAMFFFEPVKELFVFKGGNLFEKMLYTGFQVFGRSGFYFD